MIKNKKNDTLKVTGSTKFFHRLFMFVTFPIRKPLLFIPLLIIAYLLPTFMGAKPNEVHLWYWNKIKNNTTNISAIISEKTQAILPDVDISLPSMDSFKSTEKPINQIVDLPENNPQNIRRKMFEKAQEAPTTIDILKTPQVIDTVPSVVVGTTAPTVGEPKKKLALVYADNREEISGTAEVKNANELEINGKSYFLHGIYVDPNTQKGSEAKSFLKTLIGNNIIKCVIEAYTYQGVGTIKCMVNNESINQIMIDEGYSKNVALN